MAHESRSTRGRPPKPPAERKRHSLAVRARDGLRDALEKAAERNQRSLSEECEMRLERSLTDEERAFGGLDLVYGRRLSGILILLGKVMREAGAHAGYMETHSAEGSQNWFDSAYAFAQAVQAADVVLKALQPPGEAVTPRFSGGPPGLDLNHIYRNLGEGVAASALSALAGEAVSAALEEWVEDVRLRLGPEAVARLGIQPPAPAKPRRR